MPQALRVIIPPLISQYLNLTKNSSLAIAIGYLDVFFVGRTIINQAGRAVPVFSMIMITYLTISIITSIIMNIYNRRIQFIER
jgi:general L-amino acid transport system permease protein